MINAIYSMVWGSLIQNPQIWTTLISKTFCICWHEAKNRKFHTWSYMINHNQNTRGLKILFTHVCKWKNESCWNISRNGGRVNKGEWWREWIQVWYIIRISVNIKMSPQHNNNNNNNNNKVFSLKKFRILKNEKKNIVLKKWSINKFCV
jgi:hypothetical protein